MLGSFDFHFGTGNWIFGQSLRLEISTCKTGVRTRVTSVLLMSGPFIANRIAFAFWSAICGGGPIRRYSRTNNNYRLRRTISNWQRAFYATAADDGAANTAGRWFWYFMRDPADSSNYTFNVAIANKIIVPAIQLTGVAFFLRLLTCTFLP